MSQGPSLARRVALAVALTIGFYAMALGMSGGMLWVALGQLMDADRIRLKPLVFGTAAALAILWSVMPRWRRTGDPGVRLLRSDQPRLFAFLDETAARAGQTLPGGVFLGADVGGEASSRGGFLGLGARPTLYLGLGLFSGVSRSELEAVVLHELAHHRNRDVMLLPLVLAVREAIERSIENLDRVGGHFHEPFRWYGRHYLRITRSIAREEEHAADAFALEHGSPAAHRSILMGDPGPVFDAYRDEELLPALSCGVHPPLVEGYQRFAASERGQAILERVVAREMRMQTQPGWTHPALRERLAMAEGMPERGPLDERPALSLLADVPALERAVVDWWLVGPPRQREAVSWDDAGTRVVLPAWQSVVTEASGWLRGRTAADLPRTDAGYEAVARASLPASIVQFESPEALTGFGRAHCDRVATLLLVSQGFRLMSLPGEPVFCQRGDERVDIISWLRARDGKALSEEGYRFRLSELGVDGVDLGPVLEV